MQIGMASAQHALNLGFPPPLQAHTYSFKSFHNAPCERQSSQEQVLLRGRSYYAQRQTAPVLHINLGDRLRLERKCHTGQCGLGLCKLHAGPDGSAELGS